MKKLFLILILIPIGLMAQSSGALVGNGLIYADSLKNYSSTYASDSSKIFQLNYDWGFFSICVKDTGTTYTDSLKLFKGAVRYTNSYSHTKVDTLWSTEALPVKNNSWNVDTVLVGAGKTKFYMILEDNINLLKVINVNAQIVQGRKTDIIIEARKKD